MVVIHLLAELFCRYFHILHFHIEILSGTERAVLRFNIVVRNHDGEFLDGFFGIESLDDLLLFLGPKNGLLILSLLYLLAEVGGINENHVPGVGGVHEKNRNVCPSCGEYVAGHGNDSAEHLILY